VTEDGEGLSFLGGRKGSGRLVRIVILEPGDALELHPADWSDVLVVVERGRLQVECDDGVRADFESGAVLVLTMPELRRLHSVGREALILSAVSRRADPS
jgi:mannose-6-phosphate isomerase-like protein (cupin superfamily)